MVIPITQTISPYFLLALLNSKVVQFYWLNKFKDDRNKFPKIKGEYLKLIPVPKIKKEQQLPVINIVESILTILKDEDYLKNPRKQATVKTQERDIDQMVYQLYGLTEDEIKIIEDENENLG